MKTQRKAFLLLALLLTGGMASAQVIIKGNVYGGGNMGEVKHNTSVTINGGTVGKKIPLEDRLVDKNVQIHRVDFGNVYGGGNGYKIMGYNPNNNAPIFDINAGRVQGNTTVYIGGDAKVRRAVYGGGNMASVGVYTAVNGVATNYSGGATSVTIEGNALIGPKKEDLTTATAEEFAAFFGEDVTYDLQRYVDTAFKYLGGNEGWVFGSSRGISGGALRDYSFAKTTEVTVGGNAQVLNVFGSGENGHVQVSTNVTVKDNALIGGVPLHDGGTATYTVPSSGIATNEGEYKDAMYKLAVKDSETEEDNYGVGREIVRGNVFGGGKGTDFISWFNYDKYCYTSGRVYGNTQVTIQDNALIYNRVYGGGVISMVGTFEEEESADPDNHTVVDVEDGTGHTYININGGFIGSPGSNGHNCGEVYGGSRGLPGRPRKTNGGQIEVLTPLHQVVDEAYVGHTHVTVTDGTIMNSVYGGAANGHVQGDAHVLVTGGTIGTEGVGGWHGNVYGGGGGTAQYKEGNKPARHSITAGRVFGNTNVTIEGGKVYHNVYGGGAIASVGTYDHTSLTKPYLAHGKSIVTITGGTIGTHGFENGMVFGSGRGEIAPPGAFMDSLTYMAYAEVNIGTGTVDPETGVATNTSGNAKIKGSVYGSGENGHVYLHSQINIFKGTIGCSAEDYARYKANETVYADSLANFHNRGNIYGAGCGTDTYTVVIGTDPETGDPITEERFNPNAGYVQGNAEVNIYGGYISRNVYGGGAMASVGVIDHSKTVKHDNTATQTALSWPYYLEFASIPDENETLVSTGKAIVNIRGGHIGTVAEPIVSGNVFGSSRGDAVGPLYVYDTLALARETEVKINFTPSGTSITDATVDCITSSVYGSGENGTVYENTKVTLTNGLIGGSVFGGGSGTDTYAVALKNPNYDPSQPSSSTNQEYLPESQECSITAGKVYGNTEVNINGGYVLHNVYGGGNLASVGKGNYYGYGEMTNQTTGPENPYENSGTCTVNITGGTIGTNGLPDPVTGALNGFVFGSSKGKTFVNINKTPRYDYSRDFFLGYSNATEVVIGDPDLSTHPTIYGSVFGGGENGHTRWSTDVTVNEGEIGVDYVVPANYPELEQDSINKWVYRGNVYGAGRGIDKIEGTDNFCNSAGSVTLNTNVTVNGGTIHRNVYGGGSNASVGPPPTGFHPGTSTCTVNIKGGTIGEEFAIGDETFLYGGNIFGASRGSRELIETTNIGLFATANNTDVNIDSLRQGATVINSANVIGNVYGGGEVGQVSINTNVDMAYGNVKGSVFGGGKGEVTDENAALVKGNATVNMTNGTVERSIYGGGQLGNVGTYTGYYTAQEIQNTAHVLNEPKGYEANTGLATVKISGGMVGKNGSLMPSPTSNPDDDDRGWIFCGGRGEADTISYPKANLLGIVGTTYLEISETDDTKPVITASVYGGCENGLILGNTHVKIMGGQIGTGYNGGTTNPWDEPYFEIWDDAIAAINSGNPTTINNIAAQFHECHAFPYGFDHDDDPTTPDVYYVYDIFADESGYTSNGGSTQGSNGHSFFGNVFGGGSGYYPIAPGVWRRSAGRVWGDTWIEVTGGHILTSLYGGNETTDVMGKCTIDMSGGTLGVPRTIQQINDHPVTCYLFGAGMGDTRTMFNTWTNVGSVEMNITGGTIFGSIFGGGEDGHVLEDVVVNIGQDEGKSTLIGTWGYSYVDGNIFGGGRGFTGEALTAGVVGGNIDMTITGGTMLGSIFGGGRLASVGTHFTHPESNDYGQFQDGAAHGHVTIDISGGTIGNDAESGVVHTKGGNVYGGSMGRLTCLDNTNNPIWPSLAKVKSTTITIRDNALIKSNVYGGGEMGTVCKHKSETDAGETTITISGGTVKRNVFGGGYGSNITTAQVNDSVVPSTTKYASPMQIAGRVYGNTTVSMSAGTVEGGIYGGGEMASVGYITDSIKHHDPTTPNWSDISTGHHSFLSWPYEFTYASGTGTTNVSITGGTVGTTGSGNGDVFGGGMGIAGPRHSMAQCANVNNAIVSISQTSGTTSIKGNVYGGGENGHVNTDAQVTMSGGTVEQDIYGAGKGTDTYPDILYNPATEQPYANPTNVRSITAGKVYGNTTVIMNDGLVKGNIYGGGEFASVGKSNYMGYGETGDETTAQGSGHTHVYVYGGTVGTDGYGNGMVFGSSQGTTFATVNLSPRYFYSRDFFLGYSNNTTVQIGNGTSTPEIKGSVFGGGEDGHVRLSTNVNMKSGTVGETLASGADPNSDAWKLRGNVYGAGRGIDIIPGTTTYCPSAGSVTRNTTVTVEGGTIYRNVYGGGSMAAIGPPPGFTNDPSKCTVNIQGGTIGTSGSTYGGYVFGASRGIACDNATWDASNPTNPSPYTNLASCVETQVNISQANNSVPTIINNVVYGGGSNGRVSGNTEVNMNGGTVVHSIYGGGEGVYGDNGYTYDSISGRVQGNTLVNLMGGTVGEVDNNYAAHIFGGSRRSMVWGNTEVNVGTGEWNSSTQTFENLDGDITIYGSVYGANNYNGTPKGNVTVNVFKTHHEPETENVLGNWYPAEPHGTTPTTPDELGELPNEESNYAIYQVFGGSNQTDYLPRSGKEATVNVYGCEENTIFDLYGGSNAANIGKPTGYTTNANVNLYGGRINRVFGGGKGSTTTAANIYGTATTTIEGGLINAIFGGSNGNGNINEINLVVAEDPTCTLIIGNGYGGGNVAPEIGEIVTTLECCTPPTTYNNFYGGAHSAVIYGNVTLNVHGGIVSNLFGGSEGTSGEQGIAADIKKYPLGSLIAANSTPNSNNGTYPQALVDLYWNNPANYVANYEGTGGNVTVNLYGGTFTNVFGGSDVNGNIEGVVTVNVLDVEGNCPLKIANIYGASNETPYTPDDIIVEGVPQKPVSPVVNVVHIKDVAGISQNVFGAGKGNTATATSNPLVNIGYDHATMAQYIPLAANGDSIYHVQVEGRTPRAYVNGSVYGGGENGKVEGNTNVNVYRSNTIINSFVYGAGCGNDSDLEGAMLTGSTKVRIKNGLIKRSVFGGGEMAIVTGNTDVEVSGGTVGSWMYDVFLQGSVYGGGQGATSVINQGVPTVASPDFGRVMGNTYVHISGDAQILKDVFGGGQIGSVGSGNLGDNTTGVTHVTISGGQIGPFYEDEMNANVFGGSQGSVSSSDVTLYTNHANVDSTSVIVCGSAHIAGSVFGGSENGHVLAGTRVLVEKGNNTNNSTPIIGTDAMNGDGCVFGGGQGSGWFETIGSGDDEETVFHLIKHSGRVGGNTKVKMTDGTILGTIYGGGKLALTGVDIDGNPSFMTTGTHPVYDSIHHGLASIEVSGGTIGFGETEELGYALLDCDYSVGDIFGGGRGDYDNYQDILAGRVANASVNISGSPRIYCTVFGGGEIAGVGYWDNEDEKHPFVPKTGTTKVTVGGTPVIGLDYEFDPDYGEDPVEWTMFDTINNTRRMFHTCSGNIFGASQGDAAVKESPSWVSLGRSRTAYVEIKDNPTIKSSVFGGAEQGTVTEDTHVKISGGTIGQEGLTLYTWNSAGALIHSGTYSFGNVYGGGFGVDSLQVQTNDSIEIANDPTLIANVIAGRVYGNTYVNITGGTIRGNVYGGGNMASVGRWTEVKDGSNNLIDFAPIANTGETTVKVSGSTIVGPMDGTGQNAYVFGGGRGIGKDPQGLRKKYCNVNNTQVTVALNETGDHVGRVYGSLYGGGSDCHVLGNTSVTLNSGIIGTYDAEHNTITDWGGNIFGGGRNFLKMSYSPGRVAGNTNIEMNGGYVYGSIFGGGRNAVTGTALDGMKMHDGDDHGNTCVKVKGGSVGYEPLVPTFTDRPIGEVFGGGKGNMVGITLPGYPSASALLIALVKNTEVEISEADPNVPTYVFGAVYGGGEVGNVGHYTWTQDENSHEIHNIDLMSGTGNTQVTVKGGRIGLERMEMSYELVGGNGPDRFNPATNSTGNVFGGGKGRSEDPTTYGTNNINTAQYGDKYLIDLMASAGSTNVTITNDTIGEGDEQIISRPWVKGSVYGGSASGHVLRDTEVAIAGGQIGAGNSGTADIEPYDDDDFINTSETAVTDANALKGTYHWEYDANTLNPFDVVAIYNGIENGVYTYVPTDGKTWFGNVYGGGSGFLPYVKLNTTTNEYECVWNRESGMVYGNTTVNITGGHILSSVYGGCEISDVGRYTYNSAMNEYVHVSGTGKATITMSGGSVGVPRTADQIINHPVPGYVFGAGKGDSRDNFNTYTNVDTTLVTICDSAIVYGSVLGGAEQGHVIGKANVVVKKTAKSSETPVIGSSGFSGYDGHVFGGGWGDKNKFVSTPTVTYNCPAGRVGGNTHVLMTEGTVLGNVYGGGYVARTGVGIDGGYESFITILDAGTSTEHRVYDSINHGVATVDVRGGIIGNHINNGLDLLLSDQKVGNVYGGGRGSAEEYHEDDLGRVAKAVVNITSNGNNKPSIYGSVFGGGQMANVGHWNNYESWYTEGTGATCVNITGAPTIGTLKEFDLHYASGDDIKTQYETINNMRMISHTRTGNVFGGGQGDMKKVTGEGGAIEAVGFEQGHCRTTTVDISGTPTIMSCVFGGSEQGAVWGDANVIIAGGTIGRESLTADVLDSNGNIVGTDTYNYGSVFGGSYGTDCYTQLGISDPAVVDTVNAHAGRVYRNTNVEITGGTVYCNVFGGGHMASVGEWTKDYEDPEDPTSAVIDLTPVANTGKATVSVSGSAIIGPLDMTGLNAYVYGGGKGIGIDLGELHKHYGNVNSTKVTVNLGDDGHVYGSLFGGGSDGHVLGDAEVNFNGGLLGTWGTTTWDGNIFGGGRNYLASNITAGRVGGNITVNMMDGTMLGNIYGGGRLASTGIDLNGDMYTDNTENHGNIFVTVTGGTIGYEHKAEGLDANGNTVHPWVGQFGGNVFGGAMGEDIDPDMTWTGSIPENQNASNFAAYTDHIKSRIGWVRSTEVTVSSAASNSVLVRGNVFGGAKSGRVKEDTKVTIEGDITVGEPRVGTGHYPVAELFYSGSVYGAGLGSEKSVAYVDALGPGATVNPNMLWPEVGRVFGNTEVYIKNTSSGTPKIYNNIYGGGALGNVGTVNNDGSYAENTGTTYVEVSGGELGPLDGSKINAYVFAGGQGQPSYLLKDFGRVYETHLVMKDEAIVYGSLFGGGEDGHVVGNALIDMDVDPTTGILGTSGETGWDGNIFGGGRNFDASHEATGRVGGNVTINVKRGIMLGSIFGGGRLGSVGVDENGNMQEGNNHGFTLVNVGGDIQTGEIKIGHEAANDHDRVGGNVYGGGKGIAGAPTTIYPKLAKVKETTVNIMEKSGEETWIEGSVFGSGEDGHVLQDTYVNIYGGQIGGHEWVDPEDPNHEPTVCVDKYHGNVYGGGRGVDMYIVSIANPDTPEADTTWAYSATAGKVNGNANVLIEGGRIVRNVYGGGNLASVGEYQTNPETGALIEDENGEYVPLAGTGLATVTIKGGKVGISGDGDPEHGNVFGSSHGLAGQLYHELAYVHNAVVRLEGTAKVYGSVFGGGEDGHVNVHTKVSVNDNAIVGFEGGNEYKGNVYGGGRGIDLDETQNPPVLSPTAGLVKGHTRVYVNNGQLWGNVFGGGHTSKVIQERVVNINGGTVEGSVYGGGNTAPDATTYYASMKTVNVRDGHIKGNVFGCSNSANEGDEDDPASAAWTSFVNITGGTIDGSVYGSGYERRVNGSVCINVGYYPILNARTWLDENVTANKYADDSEGNDPITPSADNTNNLVIKGDIYGGSHHVATGQIEDLWNTYDVSGYSVVYIDGTDYDTQNAEPTEGQPKFMNIEGGLYGCGTHCESGAQGRQVFVRNYGKRNVTTGEQNPGELVSATRNIKTAQRCGIFLLDNANINFTGYRDISGKSDSLYAVVKISENMYVANASSMVLGSIASPAYMDSIHSIHSCYLPSGSSTIYDNEYVPALPWGWIGLKPQGTGFANELVYMNGTTSGATLTKAQENVILFNGRSRMWVRYHEKKTGDSQVKQYYGELEGFFRMRGNYFQPYGNESFAYARPKLTLKNLGIQEGDTPVNDADGGFLSYQTDFNFHTRPSDNQLYVDGDDGGLAYTNTKQYPYTNVMELSSKGDLEEFRMWVIPRITGRPWYVDGRTHTETTTSGIGVNDMAVGRGLYPDLPKLTVSADLSTAAVASKKGIYAGAYDFNNTEHISFNQKDDVIYVVGAVSSAKELEVNVSGILNQISTVPLRLYRYPGGHVLSPTTGATDPGANYKALVEVEACGTNQSLTLNNVVVDGLFGYEGFDAFNYAIPNTFDEKGADVPLVITHANAVLNLKGDQNANDEIVTNGTILQRGYNGIDVSTITITQDDKNYTFDNFYPNPDFNGTVTVTTQGDTPTSTDYTIYNGGALFVDEGATVNVEGLVTITGNKQRRMVGPNDHAVECNVYLPTFSKSLTITGALTAEVNAKTLIGITSPIRNKADHYKANTFSPVAVAHKAVLLEGENQDLVDKALAFDAWTNNNFTDDQNWFFVRDCRVECNDNPERTTYYDDTEGTALDGNTLYFGWTWANVVRKQPATGDLSGDVTNDFNYSRIDSPEDLAWLISVVNGENSLTASPLTNQPITQTADFDLKRYVWVPIGRKAAALDLENHPFKGKYDGQGHIITNLSIEYLGKGDRHYELDNYGLFGLVNNAEIKRTFVVSGLLKPESVPVNGSKDDEPIFNIGGLVGYLEGANAVVSNSEAAVEIVCPNYSFAHNVVAGGLVGQMANGLIHSSMAMPVMSVGAMTTGKVGGLVGNSSEGKVHNSFVNAEFGVLGSNDGQKIGGLLGANAGAKVRNCYVALHGTDLDENFDGLVNTVSGGSIDSCYVEEGYSYATNTTYYGSLVKSFTPASSADTYGYMYLDNTVLTSIGTKPVDTAMFRLLNHWVYNKHKKSHATDSIYAHWARPGLAYYEIKTTTGGGEKDGTMVLKTPFNDDLPVLLLSEFDKRDDAGIVKYQGGFRSVGTYAGGYALQYGGPDRDGTGNTPSYASPDLDGALIREGAGDCLFIYGDIITTPTQLVQAKKVSIHEDVSILHPGSLTTKLASSKEGEPVTEPYTDTYVGVTFDNSHSNGEACSTWGVNFGLVNYGPYALPRDWHMFSTPLQEAPLGFNYMLGDINTNTTASTTIGDEAINYFNNPWVSDAEFSWLQSGGSDNVRYWMKGWENSQSQKSPTSTLGTDWVDGYFPSQATTFGSDLIIGSDECPTSTNPRYPYGMDFYTWTEPDYHWINFKRNGPNHWHSDGEHDHLPYKPLGIENSSDYPPDVNEDNLIVGRGYMASIGTETLLQSHGTLNVGTKEILLTNSGSTSKLPGWNLVGNPYHGYLDFDLVGTDSNNSGILSTVSLGSNNVPFYVIYDADMFEGEAESAFRYYPVTGSVNGDYAGRYLHPHQGFYVKKKDGGNANMRFTEDMIVSRSVLTAKQDGHFRDWQPKYPLVNLYLSSDNGCADVTVIEFNRPEWNGAIKLKELRVGNGLFYGQHDGTHYAALFAQEGAERVPLWFEAKEDDIFTIKWNTANGDFHSMYLIDNIAGVQYDMLRNDTYTFEGHTGDYPSRFYIVFDVTGVDEFDEGDHNFVFFDGSQWVVTGDGVLDFIDVHGRVLWSSSVSGQSRVGLPKVACGVYLMRLTNSNGTKVQKVIINKI